MPILIMIIALTGLTAIGALLGLVCWALEAADKARLPPEAPPPPPTRQRQPGSLYARLLRSSIEGPEDEK